MLRMAWANFVSSGPSSRSKFFAHVSEGLQFVVGIFYLTGGFCLLSCISSVSVASFFPLLFVLTAISLTPFRYSARDVGQSCGPSNDSRPGPSTLMLEGRGAEKTRNQLISENYQYFYPGASMFFRLSRHPRILLVHFYSVFIVV